jgi:hypothetical protein
MNFAYGSLRRAKPLLGWSAALLVLAAVVSTAAAQPKEVLVYQFDPSTDNLAAEGGILDRSGNGYNGTALSLGAPSMKFASGHLSNTFAVAMAGDDYFPGTGIWTGVSTTTVGIYQGAFTVMAWVNVNNLHTNVIGDQMVFGSVGQETLNNTLHLGFRNRNTYMGFWGNDSNAAGAPQPFANVWHHMAWRYDPGTKNQDIFIDGKLANSDPNHAPFDGRQTLLLGRTFPTLNGDQGAFSGMIEYPRVFNVALRNDQIAAAAQDQPVPP